MISDLISKYKTFLDIRGTFFLYLTLKLITILAAFYIISVMEINLFFGLDKEINRSFSFLLEYDAAYNDDNSSAAININDITFGKGKGYLNAGLRWAIAKNLLFEFNFNNISRNTDAKYTDRELKIMYSEFF